MDVVRVVVIMKPSKAVRKDAAWTGWALASATAAEPDSASYCITALMGVSLLAANNKLTRREFRKSDRHDVRWRTRLERIVKLS